MRQGWLLLRLQRPGRRLEITAQTIARQRYACRVLFRKHTLGEKSRMSTQTGLVFFSDRPVMMDECLRIFMNLSESCK
jgi:hypothetical protein